jgi:hypothetical protein
LAKIEVSSLGPNPKTVQVVYHFKHNGHVPGSLNDLKVVGLSDGLKNVIYNLVDQNLTWVNIKHLIRLDRTKLASILNGETTNIPEAMRVSYNTVYYAVKKCMERRAYLNVDMVTRLRQWGNEKIAPEGFFFERNLDEHQRGMYVFAFMSRWQLNVSQVEDKIDVKTDTCLFYTDIGTHLELLCCLHGLHPRHLY